MGASVTRLERDPAAVLRDVLNELVTVETARDVYRVAFAPGDPPTVDVAATGRLRAAPGR